MREPAGIFNILLCSKIVIGLVGSQWEAVAPFAPY